MIDNTLMSKDLTRALTKKAPLDPIAEARRQWVNHGWEKAAPGMAAVTTIVRVQQILSSRIEGVLRPLGLTFARFEILRLLGFTRQGRLPMGKIGERLQVHPASVTSAVKRLERDRLIKRVASPNDNRVSLAVLLPLGRQRLATATEVVNAVFENLELDTDEADSLIWSLSAIRRSAGDHTG